MDADHDYHKKYFYRIFSFIKVKYYNYICYTQTETYLSLEQFISQAYKKYINLRNIDHFVAPNLSCFKQNELFDKHIRLVICHYLNLISELILLQGFRAYIENFNTKWYLKMYTYISITQPKHKFTIDNHLRLS